MEWKRLLQQLLCDLGSRAHLLRALDHSVPLGSISSDRPAIVPVALGNFGSDLSAFVPVALGSVSLYRSALVPVALGSFLNLECSAFVSVALRSFSLNLSTLFRWQSAQFSQPFF